ncbi:hypothetical protein PIB30_060920 [Stylosanthes scabra]|uniref:Uncharacterized protein n=1 Tax=Stylosanthes scabra TaxID=79078 RepID=A0ABU6RKL9_9FABA|nr:hypothetical protein [Stylosanthes scabra]
MGNEESVGNEESARNGDGAKNSPFRGMEQGQGAEGIPPPRPAPLTLALKINCLPRHLDGDTCPKLLHTFKDNQSAYMAVTWPWWTTEYAMGMSVKTVPFRTHPSFTWMMRN